MKRIMALTLAFVLAGCQSKEEMIKPDDPFYAPVQPSHIAPPPASNGSLYQQNYSMTLYGDRKAYRVGDVITVLLTETTSSKKSTNASLSKSNDVTIANPTIFGQQPVDLATSIQNDTSFAGKGATGQSNSLEGSITVTVHQIYPNGLMLVKGEKWLNLTNGSEVIRVSGLLRPDDVSPENTAMSTKLADARLTYSGTGDLADTTRQGWLTRFFNSSWWPF
ncbi:flagellar basal body L-ring protein FlgH [Oceanospirillum sanctuarii]|uniref:flagellar basal body L-ring protein FlgH n=1 Tax=Oceanospirillum sanctuarii TaxID=1434821 RepID=UPI000A384733|nr:flagellar basal body L-ring protein FlgH [Oceanospirillum sanctuarii]